MGWHINLVKNEVVITKKIAKELLKCDAQISCSWQYELGEPYSDEDIMDYRVAYKDDDGTYRLYFNDDHLEHMDYVWEEEVQAVLKKHKVKGDICFSSDDGDNAGAAWGYRFDGKGGMVRLEADRQWKEVQPEKLKRGARVSKSKSKKKK